MALTLKIAGHIVRNKLAGRKRFATVLQLEPLHTCNLTCTGCGRIREYSTSLKDLLPLEDCLAAARECDAPMVSICGGEPLIYPKIDELIRGLLAQKRVVYVCTNGMFLRKRLRSYLAAQFSNHPAATEPLLAGLLRQELITDAQAAEIREGKGASEFPIAPTQWLYWNIHLDGAEYTHDLIVEREGVFRECIAAIRMAKALGYQVATNTTVYKESDMEEIRRLFAYLGTLGVDGHTISPGYDYDAAKEDMRKRLGLDPANFFLTRETTRSKFRNILRWAAEFPLLGTPVYFEFLAGKRELPCSAWAIPTRNIRGWKGPCYLMTDAHHPTYAALLENTDWDRYGVVEGVARDPRCENCMVHCGYEPSATLGIGALPGDTWKNLVFNFGPRPRPVFEGTEDSVFNGVSAGRGHLTGINIQPAPGCGSTKAELEISAT